MLVINPAPDLDATMANLSFTVFDSAGIESDGTTVKGGSGVLGNIIAAL